MEDIRKCAICGKPYVLKHLEVGTFKRDVYVVQCDCEVLRAEKEKQLAEYEKKREIARRKTNELKDALNCPLVTPFFKSKTFDNLAHQNKNVEFCKEYAQNFNKKTSTGMLMVGNIGTGKTTLQACICNELENKGYICLLTTFSALLDLFIESCSINNNISTNKMFRTLAQFDYVVLDDLGREKYTDKRLEFAFRIIDTLMNYNVIVSVTANNEPLEKLGAIPEYKAIFDRIRCMCGHRLEFSGQSFRRVRL